jgi:MFS family permease
VRSRSVLAFGLALAYSLALLDDNMMYVFLPSHPGAAGIAAASLGIVLSANRFVRLAANSPGGLLSDRLGRRRPYLLGMMLALASTTGYLVSDGLWPLSMGEGLLHPAVVVWTGDGALPHLRGVVMGGLATAGDLGAAIGPLVAYALLETAGLGAAYGLCAILTFSALLLLAAVRVPPACRPGRVVACGQHPPDGRAISSNP